MVYWQDILQYTVNGLTVGSFYALVALGYTMIYGIIRLINFAHGEVFTTGAYLGWLILSALAGSFLSPYVGIAVALLLAMPLTGLLGMGLARVAYLPILKAPRLTILITALGASIALQNFYLVTFGAGFKTYPHLLGHHSWNLAGVQVKAEQLAFFLLSLGLMLLLNAFIFRTPLGMAMRALALDQDAARLMGIPVERVILITFFIAGSLAAAAGIMYGMYYTQISFFMGFLLGLRAFTAAVLGGIGNIPGAVLGGFLIGILEAFAAGYLGGQWKDVVVFAVLILVLTFRPQGILGERVVERM
ncbi:MAG: branched-chain amino acid ABC transporter permease [Clostridiales bacterium]|nr:branched-chain amino acid ABC transporter permease [Clostridiales bacterium]